MKISLSTANIVILAANHNPTIVTKDWLASKGIIIENPVNFAHTPVFSFFESPNYSLTVDEGRLQITPKNFTPVYIEQFKEIGIKYVDTLPETPYKAIGLNYTYWTMADENVNAIDLLGKTLSLNLAKIQQFTSSQECYLGTIIYCYIDQIKLKILIEPKLDTGRDMVLNFNYHYDIKKPEDLKIAISSFDKNLKDSEELAKKFFEG